ncbi:MAG: hypothetical protein N3D14_03480 [Aquificaceae bacterium]|nr:hypothetical protein [Aquificaceae bacterium]MCX8164436.1 hypothetical protein [Aquificaceae bacterium]
MRAPHPSRKEGIYAYSLTKRQGGYLVVGGVGSKGNYDGFVLWLGKRLIPLKALKKVAGKERIT